PQKLAGELREAMRSGPVGVRVSVQGAASAAAGEVAFIDTAIDPGSGTIAVRAVIGNEDETLWPGEFVTVTTTLRVEPDAVVVPAPAVQIGQDSAYVFVVRPDRTVEMRPVTVARTLRGESVIASGLAKGETVVVDGQLRLTVGTRVEVQQPAARANK